ncbi:MAG: glycosyltransferase, partial [Wenzhouxiangella sp.]
MTIVIPVGPTERVRPKVLEQLTDANRGWQILVAATAEPEWNVPVECHLLTSPAGRAQQQNHAARQASGDWLWFLHADCELAHDAPGRITTFIEQAEDALGYCWLKFLNDGPRLTALNAVGANVRSRWFNLPYGDQGLCMPRSWFEKLGGLR